MPEPLTGPVGLRWRTQSVKNLSRDQRKVSDLLAAIPDGMGGKKNKWSYATPLLGDDGSCTKYLADAIWDFQTFWKSMGVFHNIDGVVDPGMHTWQTLTEVAGGQPPKPQNIAPSGGGAIGPGRISGTWQITNVWSIGTGEVGLVGAVQLDITAPDESKFRIKGAGAGFGWSMDPKGLNDLLNKTKDVTTPLSLKALSEMLGRGVGFGFGDLLQKVPGFPSLTPTAGRIFSNPLRGVLGLNQPPVTKRLLTGGGSGNNVFGISSASGGAIAGAESGLVVFGMGGLATGWLANAFAVYGTAGITFKSGAGVSGMLYNLYSVEDL